MTQTMVRLVRTVMALLAVVLLAAVGVAVLPAGHASASDDLTAWFSQDPDTALQPCTTPGTFWYPGAAQEVYNPCGGRVWVHYISGSAVASYCVNPGGGLAYDLPITWKPGDSTNIELTSDTADCDAGNLFGLNWCATASIAPCPNALPTDPIPDCGVLCDGNPGAATESTDEPVTIDGVVIGGYECQPGGGPGFITHSFVYQTWDAGCDFRIWLHEYDSASGQSLCLSPGQITAGLPKEYWDVTESWNQAPCSAGNPPYPY